MDQSQLSQRMLAHRHVLAVLLASRPEVEGDLETLLRAADTAHRRNAEAASLYRDEVSLIKSTAQRLRDYSVWS